MLAAAKPLILLLSLFLTINVEACSRPQKPERRCCNEIKQDYCFDYKYGLFENTPQCPNTFSPTFKLFTRTATSGVSISRDNVPSEFSNNRKTVIIVPGWVESFGSKYENMTGELLTVGDYNVIAVDWKKGTYLSNYVQSTENTETMGAYLGSLVNVLRNQPGSWNNFWCIGHGMGAHVCGYTSKIASPLLERITGVDPNGLLYSSGLKKGDAKQVDVIHTDSTWGSNKPRGDVDFYPNGGTGQPGCNAETITLGSDELNRKMLNGGPVTCDHGMALNYMIYTIRNHFCYVATHECSDYNNLDTSCTEIPRDVNSGAIGFLASHFRYEGLLSYKANNTYPHCSPRGFRHQSGGLPFPPGLI